MKDNKKRLYMISRFEEAIEVSLRQYYHQALSDNAKKAWENRWKLSLHGKLQCKAM